MSLRNLSLKPKLRQILNYLRLQKKFKKLCISESSYLKSNFIQIFTQQIQVDAIWNINLDSISPHFYENSFKRQTFPYALQTLSNTK